MAKIYFNTRDDLTAVDVNEIAVAQANGNYTKIVTRHRREVTVTTSISKVESALRDVKGDKPVFVRLGRSLIVNHDLLLKVDLQRQMVVLTYDGHDIRVGLPKGTLKTYKDAIVKSIEIQRDGDDYIGYGRQPAV